MTGNDIFETAIMLLGYTDSSRKFQDSSKLKERALCAINQIARDLGVCATAESLFDEIAFNDMQSSAAPYGVAMLLSLIDGDSDKNTMFSSIYNAKRAAAKNETGSVRDVLPKGGETL